VGLDEGGTVGVSIGPGTTYLNPTASTTIVFPSPLPAMAVPNKRFNIVGTDISSVGLFFTQTEFIDLVSRLFPAHLHSSSTPSDITEGHVGASYDFIIITHDVGPFALK
jgi:hypothetical protein